MHSKTPFLHKTLFIKNITRFLPLWGGYLLCLLLGATTLPNKEDNFFLVTSLSGLHEAMAPIGMVLAFLTVQALFGDLYDPRLCATLHAMPLDRGVIYRTGVVSGLLFSLVPTAILAVILLFPLSQVAVPNACLLALSWWVYAGGYYLFFFGSGVVCAVLAGNRLGQAALYGIVNLGGTLMYFLVDQIFEPLLYGFVTPERPFTRLSPGVYGWLYDAIKVDYTWTHPVVDGSYTLVPELWRYVLAVAIVGLLLILAGGRLYRRRDLEKAGDFLAWQSLQPVVLVAISLCAGAALPFLCKELFYRSAQWLSYLLLAVGISVGWFAGKMLLERTVWVFRPRNFLGLGILAAVLAVSLGLTKLDVLGIENRMPDPQKVVSVSIDRGQSDDPAFLEQVLTLHTLALENRVPPELMGEAGINDDRYVDTLRIFYNLENGDVMARTYSFLVDSPTGEAARQLLSSPPCVFDMLRQSDDDDYVTEQTVLDFSGEPVSISLFYDKSRLSPSSEFMTRQTVDKLLSATLADCRAGTMVRNLTYHPTVTGEDGKIHFVSFPMNLVVKAPDPEVGKEGTRSLFVEFSLDSANTLAVLEEIGITREALMAAWEEENRMYG